MEESAIEKDHDINQSINQVIESSKSLSCHEHELNLVMVIWYVGPTNRRQWVNRFRFKSSFEPRRKLSQYPNFISQWQYEMINVENVFELTDKKQDTDCSYN